MRGLSGGARGLAAIGALSLVPYAVCLALGDLRAQTWGFVGCFAAAFVLYAAAVGLVLRDRGDLSSPRSLAVIVGFAVVFRAIMVLTPPHLSDDMYRYVWDGRVQAGGLSPYAHPPAASALAGLRDDAVWPLINRPEAVTVYPAGAELAFAALWRIVPDNVRWFQVAMAAGSLLAGLLLIPLLRAAGQPASRALILLWSPLAVFETAHAAHVDGLVLPLLVGAWLARLKGRDGLVGVCLGVATALKLYPAVLLPVLWRTRDEAGHWRPAWRTPALWGLAFALPYAPYLAMGAAPVGFLPTYFGERFNGGLGYSLGLVFEMFGGPPERGANALVLLALAAVGGWVLVRPPATPLNAVRRCVWPIGAFTLLTPNLHPWYMLWLVPLLALALAPGRPWFRPDAWGAWLLFTGSVALSYLYFADPGPVVWGLALAAEYVPLYLLLGLALWRSRRRPAAAWRPRAAGAGDD